MMETVAGWDGLVTEGFYEVVDILIRGEGVHYRERCTGRWGDIGLTQRIDQFLDLRDLPVADGAGIAVCGDIDVGGSVLFTL